MCGSQRPADGADSYDITLATSDALQGDTATWLRALCSTCEGRGTVQVDEGLASCPACHGKEECGTCGRFSADTEPLTDGRVTWRRCRDCKRQQDAAYREQVA